MRVLTDASCIRVLTTEKIIVGIGSELVLFHVASDGRTRRDTAPLPRLEDKIHGIDFKSTESDRDGSWLIVFYAGREAFSIALHENIFSELTSIPLDNTKHDVLYYAQERILLLHSPNRLHDWITSIRVLADYSICLMTGHGVAVNLIRVSGHWEIVDVCPCEDSSTLYCSQFVGSRWQDLLCLCGTALGQLVIWRPTGERKGRIMTSIGAHNGVVFSIECDLERNFLTTTSDDRSVKFWTMKSLVEEDRIELEEMNYCFGHTARVFQCRIIPIGEMRWVVSIGEDSNLCLWDETGNLLVKKCLEDGATLWGLDYDPESQNVFVCASNGNVSKFSLEKYLLPGRGQDTSRDVTPIIEKGFLTKVKFVSDGSLVAITNANQILLVRDSTKPEVIDQLETFKCSILEVSEDRIFVAGDKYLNIYDTDIENERIKLVKSIHLDFDRAEFPPEAEPIKFAIIRSLHLCNSGLVLCDNNGRCILYNRDVEQVKACLRLPKTSERWLTACYGIDRHLLLADRGGNLFLYDERKLEPLFKLQHLHGKLGVTQISLDEQTPNGYFLATSGHDGKVRSIFMDKAREVLQVYGSEKAPISWIERMDEQLLMGFNDSHFVVAGRSGQELLCEVDCGGGHRFWDCFRGTGGHCRFVFIQHKRLVEVAFQLERVSKSFLDIPRLNWHSRACNTVQVVRDIDGGVLFVSGGEDNVMRINRFCSDTGCLQDNPRKHLYCHISSIKSICCTVQRREGKFLLFSAGGRAQLCLTTLDPVTLRTKDELTYMLLSSDSDRARWRNNRTTSFDPETRFMCAVLLERDSRLFIGCSDGFLREFTVSDELGCYQVDLVKETYYKRCILHITSLIVWERSVIVTMATDGDVCFWDAQNLNSAFQKLNHHASGINGFDLRPTDGPGQFLIGTGGDDQALAISKVEIRLTKKGEFCLQTNNHIRHSVHTGQVTGIRFSSTEMIWSAGVDQMVYLMIFAGFKQMNVLKKIRTCVADVKGLQLLPETDQLFVYGTGFEFIRLNSIETPTTSKRRKC